MSTVSRYRTLDGLRGLAAILVAMFHLGQRTTQLVPVGYLAVDFFFALSGFVIAATYSERLAGSLTIARFLKARIVRLYPMYLAGFVIGGAIALGQLLHNTSGHMSPLAVLASLSFGAVMVPNPFDDLLFPLNGPSWSLFLEIIVNLLFALVLFRMSSWALLAIAVFAALYLDLSVVPPGYANLGWGWSNLAEGSARTLFSFPVGMLLFRHRAPLIRAKSWLFLIPALMLILALTLPMSAGHEKAREIIFIIALSPMIIVLGTIWETPQAAERVCEFLGDVSFPLYAVQRPFLALYTIVENKLLLPLWLLDTAFAVSMIAIAAVLAYRVDAPVRRALSRFLDLTRSAEVQLE